VNPILDLPLKLLLGNARPQVRFDPLEQLLCESDGGVDALYLIW
jgi:hypothetical protein